MCLIGDNTGHYDSQDVWAKWTKESKAIASEHISLKMKALREYRDKGLFSYRNLKHYISTVVELDRFYTKAHLDAWNKATRARKIETLRQDWQREVDLANGEDEVGFAGA